MTVTKISCEMKKCLLYCEANFRLVRYPGGFWSAPNAKLNKYGAPYIYFSKRTILALVKRDLMFITNKKEGHSKLTFPTEVILNSSHSFFKS